MIEPQWPELPAWSERLFFPSRYKVPYGGRGSSKSWTVARALLCISLWPNLLFPNKDRLRILCAREFQNSIEESVHQLLSDQIEMMNWDSWFDVQQRSITSVTGSEFIFSGIQKNVKKIKSMERIDICWVEEAEVISDNSWQVLIPTVRQTGSEIWATFNPDQEDDPTYKRFVLEPPPDCDSFPVNYTDNPWFPEELRKEMEYLFRVDPESAEHVWNGKCNTRSDAVIFRNKYRVESFVPVTDRDHDCDNWSGPYYGGDWGFASDPTALSKLWVFGRKLYIEKESWGLGIELDDIAPRWREDIPEVDQAATIRADSSRPETISHVAKKGHLPVVACEKWSGSVEDGVSFLKSFEEIIIHPRCKHHIEEARTYKYKVDKLTGQVLREIVDSNNHLWDCDRYALDRLIKSKRSIYEVL